ncbi:hypothetical protein PA598K_05139 [Paenibacillus sp. 598K]|nr:hypothetical protein PA598K_05139 [Paenibacillus sp. 598K]
MYLSFDDGPSEWTPQVLDILQEEQVSATFFVLGSQAERRGETIRRIVREGHALGNHTYNHKYDELYSSFDGLWQQVERTGRILAELTGSEPALMRAPGGTHGHFDAFYYYYLERAGYTVYDWNVDSGDSRRRGVPAADILANVKAGKLQHEVHVLMHDSAGHGETVKALPDIIAYYKAKGYRFAAYDSTVRPVQYTLAPSKHQRVYTAAGHRVMLEQLRAYEETRQVAAATESGAVVSGEKAANEAMTELSIERAFAARLQETRKETAAALATVRPLLLHSGEETLRLDAGEYEMLDGRLAVPLRSLTDWLGDAVWWDDKRRLAYAEHDGQTLVFDPGTSRVGTEESGRVQPLAGMQLRQGSLYVPLREVAELFGYEVTGYSPGTEQLEVKLRLLGGPSVAVAAASVRSPGTAELLPSLLLRWSRIPEELAHSSWRSFLAFGGSWSIWSQHARRSANERLL